MVQHTDHFADKPPHIDCSDLIKEISAKYHDMLIGHTGLIITYPAEP